jgi:hypothetical protein
LANNLYDDGPVCRPRSAPTKRLPAGLSGTARLVDARSRRDAAEQDVFDLGVERLFSLIDGLPARAYARSDLARALCEALEDRLSSAGTDAMAGHLLKQLDQFRSTSEDDPRFDEAFVRLRATTRSYLAGQDGRAVAPTIS